MKVRQDSISSSISRELIPPLPDALFTNLLEEALHAAEDQMAASILNKAESRPELIAYLETVAQQLGACIWVVMCRSHLSPLPRPTAAAAAASAGS